VDDTGEDGIIARYFRPLAQHPGAFGLIDDAAILTPPDGADLVLKADAIISGVHFFPDDPPDTIARKALRVNLSDLAAKGAEPAGFLLSLALPEAVTEDWLAAFSAGLKADADHYGCPLMGGDTDKTPGPAMISTVAFGRGPRGTMVRRSGAQAGDIVAVTGTIGDAALGLRLRSAPDAWGLDEPKRAHLAGRYLLPEPRNILAPAVRAYASGAMDVSDGLVGDLAKLCRASGVAAEVEVSHVPLSAAARRAIAADATLVETVLTGGDDYEILCTMPPANFAAFSEAASRTGVAVTAIGQVAAGNGTRFLDDAGKSLTFARGSYSHF
jgi:thiamine-monophosphate kinase